MDLQLARTFLTVLANKSFVKASESLLVSQSAISLRIQKLEDLIGKELLVRSKGGVEPTVYGEQFEEYARAFVQLWDEARYQTSLPDGFDGSLSLACEDSLWPELSATWVRALEADMPTTAVSFSVLAPDTLTRGLIRGNIDIALVYSPEIRPGLQVEHILEDLLVLVTADPEQKHQKVENYVYCDWGQEFAIAHSRWFPGMKPPQLNLRLGTLLPRFLIETGKAAYMPYRIADDYIAHGKLFFIDGAPRFPFPAYAVWAGTSSSGRTEKALQHLRSAAEQAPWIHFD